MFDVEMVVIVVYVVVVIVWFGSCWLWCYVVCSLVCIRVGGKVIGGIVVVLSLRECLRGPSQTGRHLLRKKRRKLYIACCRVVGCVYRESIDKR